MASYLQARVHSGEWIIRIEDIDPDREPRGAISSILQTLFDYGFVWDERPIYQSRQHNLHNHIASRIYNDGLAYYCSCSRKDLAAHLNIGSMGSIYPGTCANRNISAAGHNLRVRTDSDEICFVDRHFGKQTGNLKSESGDYVIYRADKLPSYIFAVSIDDIFERYTEVVRGADLLNITLRQVHLSQLLNKSQPNFFHIPIITDNDGNKLSKQTHAPALKKHEARSNLYFALQDLGQNPPHNLLWRPLWAVWEWAIINWNIKSIPQQKHIVYDH